MKLSALRIRLPLLLLLLAVVLSPGAFSRVGPAAPWWPATQQQARPGTESLPAAGFVPGGLLLKPVPGARLVEDGFQLGYPVQLREELPGLGVLRLEVPVGRETEAVQRLREDPRVEWVEVDHLRDLTKIPSDQLYRQFQWDMRRIQAEEAWDITTGSPEVIVAVLDTGIDGSHPDLAGKLVPGYDFLNDDSSPEDDSGHGTHNAGIIAAASNNGAGIAGVAWGARIMPIKVLNAGGMGPDSVIAKGLVYAADHGARVINMSFGNPSASRLLSQAIQYAYGKGAVLVAAAGNSANQGNAVIYPAAYDQVLAVAATDEEDSSPDFSQHHPYVGISAPGVGIVSTFWRGGGFGEYAAASGTSAAAPHVSGVAALMRSINPDLSNARIKEMLEETADDLGVPGRDEYYGAGRVNTFRAVAAARTGIATRPAQPTPAPAPPLPAAALPQGRTSWYFAEGSTAPPFDLWLLLQNPNPTLALAVVTYMKTDGTQQLQQVALPPASRRSLYVNQIVPRAELSMKVESDSFVLAERAMYFRSDGHDSVGARAPSQQWYMAEGSTRTGFDSWLLLQNPQTVQANVRLTFLTEQGERRETVLAVPPTSRRSLYLNQLVPDAEVATVVSSDQPIIAERTMYFHETGGHGGLAANQLARNWYLAEGRVGQGLDSWLLAMNPNPAPANLKVTFMGEDGSLRTGYYTLRPWSRLSLYMNRVAPAGKVGTHVESDQPVVVERSTYFAEGRGGTNVVATPALSQDWFLPEGSTRQPFTEEIALLNPGNRPARVAVTFMKSDGGLDTRTFAMNPTSRLTLRVNDLVPDGEISARVTADSPIAVERSMYFANGLGGTSSFGIPR